MHNSRFTIKTQNKTFVYRVFLCFALCIVSGCKSKKHNVDVSNINVNIVADRLENDLVNHGNDISWFKEKYSSFFSLYVTQIIHIAATDTSPDTLLLKKQLSEWVNDPDIKNIDSDTKKVYPNFDDINRQLTDAFKHYKYY